MKKFKWDHEKRACPVCGKHELLLFDVCDECGWENSPIQYEDPDLKGGANHMSLNEAKAAYAAGETVY